MWPTTNEDIWKLRPLFYDRAANLNSDNFVNSVKKTVFLSTTNNQLKTDQKRDRLVFLIPQSAILAEHANNRMHPGQRPARPCRPNSRLPGI
jgi:hypothetical protein